MRPIKKFMFTMLNGLILLGIVITVGYVEVNKYIFAHRVENYLIEEQHYGKGEIDSVRGVWGVKLPSFFAVVKFSDEPEVEYTYYAHAGVLQISHKITLTGQRSGIRESDLKHVEPWNPY